jgi:hypothetical protein
MELPILRFGIYKIALESMKNKKRKSKLKPIL